ncbi:MAG: molybdopterin molybdotransferase MoeA [Intestinibacter sp.]
MKLAKSKEVIKNFLEEYNVDRKTEIVPLDEALNRVLAEDILSKVTIPMVRASMLDGIAVCSSMFENVIPDTSNWTLGCEYVRADTGDDFDDKYDSIIRIEDVSFDENNKLHINPDVKVTPGCLTKPAGSSLQYGEFILRKNVKLLPTDLAAIAMAGMTEVSVYKKPIVGFIPTGSELIAVGEEVTRGKNIDSNSVLAKFMLKEMGADVINYPIVKDDFKLLEKALDKALSECDIVILNGGSSKGEEDFNARLLKSRGKIYCHGTTRVPGRPLCLAMIDNKPVINLPGPAIGAFNGLTWCINPIVDKFLNLPSVAKQKITGIITEDLERWGDVEFLSMMDVKKEGDQYYITPLDFKSMNLARCMSANAMYVFKLGGNAFKKGDLIEVELLRDIEHL